MGSSPGRPTLACAWARSSTSTRWPSTSLSRIRDDHFEARIKEERVSAETALDGIYVLRTRVPAERLSASDTVRSYKKLSNVERAFRSLKTVDLDVRPIYHRLEDRVRSHIFLCTLAQYVRWHMQEAWRPLLFCDEDQKAKETRDPVAPATRSAAAQEKATEKTLDDGTPSTASRPYSAICERLYGTAGVAAEQTPTLRPSRSTPSLPQSSSGPSTSWRR